METNPQLDSVRIKSQRHKAASKTVFQELRKTLPAPPNPPETNGKTRSLNKNTENIKRTKWRLNK